MTIQTTSKTIDYESWKGRKPSFKYFHIFGSKCCILVDKEQRRKLDAISDEGIFLVYSTNTREYRVFNDCTHSMMEVYQFVVDDL